MHRPKSHLIALASLGTSVLGTTLGSVAEVPDVSARQTPVNLPTFATSSRIESNRDLATERHTRQQHQVRRK